MSGTERGFACLGHDTISVNLLHPGIKRNPSIDRKIGKEGWDRDSIENRNKEGKEYGWVYRDWRTDERGGRKHIMLMVHLNIH